MKNKFNKSWKSSKQPRKQRKYRANAPLHLRKKFVSVNLSKELRKKLGKRNIVIKKGDKVKIMRGKYKGKTGKILEVKLKLSKVIIEGIQVKKQDGSKANVKLQPSNLQIIEMTERIKKVTTESSKKTKEKKETTKKESKPIKKSKENKK
jgi:large subunit ribosomal protein L24